MRRWEREEKNMNGMENEEAEKSRLLHSGYMVKITFNKILSGSNTFSQQIAHKAKQAI